MWAVLPGPRVEEGRGSFRVCQARRVLKVQDADPALRVPRAGSRLARRRRGLPRFAAPEAAAGGGLGQGRSDRVILALGGAGSPCGAHRSLGRGASAGRGAWPSALSADARAQSGWAGWGLPCGRPAISRSPLELGDSGPSLSASAKPCLEGPSGKGREDPPETAGPIAASCGRKKA